jgi:hypothetical protein
MHCFPTQTLPQIPIPTSNLFQQRAAGGMVSKAMLGQVPGGQALNIHRRPGTEHHLHHLLIHDLNTYRSPTQSYQLNGRQQCPCPRKVKGKDEPCLCLVGTLPSLGPPCGKMQWGWARAELCLQFCFALHHHFLISFKFLEPKG